MSERRPHILFTVLDWGLGHATRSIPLISEILRRGARVTLAGEGASLELLRQEFPELEHHIIKGIRIRYPRSGMLHLWMFLQAFRLSFTIRKEHSAFRVLVKKIQPDAIISDNRYGAWVEGVPSYLICHQIQVLLPAGLAAVQPLFNRLYLRLFKPFREIWIPDMEQAPGLAGILSHPEQRPLHSRYIGLLSRFNSTTGQEISSKHEVTAVVSGPEPHRSSLVSRLKELLRKQDYPSLLITGEPQEEKRETVQGMLKTVSHLDTKSMMYRLMCSQVLILRPGYSTLMDLCALGKTAICIPTPGQTEQEFLARLHQHKPLMVLRQNELNDGTDPFGIFRDGRFPYPVNTGVENTIDHLLKSIA